MESNVVFQILWVVCGVVTVFAGSLAHRHRRALVAGRVATGILFVIGGALLHLVNLLTDADYIEFADPAHFAWVTETWRDVVGPNQALFIGLLTVFEAAVGVLVIGGGARTRLGYVGVIGFYLALWLFGWIETVWVATQLPFVALLLRSEYRRTTELPAKVEGREPVGVSG